jgi:large subunit ribosomal protein L7A
MTLEEITKASRKVVGQKQTLRVLKSGEAKKVILAEDAEKKIREPVLQECANRGIKVYMAENMAALGKACGIKVGASVVAILED